MEVISNETAAADPDGWCSDAERSELKLEIIKLLSEPSRAIKPSAAKPRRRLSGYAVLYGMILAHGSMFGFSSDDLVKLAQKEFGAEIAYLEDLSFWELSSFYKVMEREASSLNSHRGERRL